MACLYVVTVQTDKYTTEWIELADTKRDAEETATDRAMMEFNAVPVSVSASLIELRLLFSDERVQERKCICGRR